MMPVKLYRQVPIQECHEPLVAIPLDLFPVVTPHPYQALGAPYGEKSPFWVRQGVCDRLIAAQTQLQQVYPGWQILIFDAFRPLPVQQFMVDYTFAQQVQQQGLQPANLTAAQRQAIFEQVYEFWALPDPDPTRPPPHSTGGAIDVTLIDAKGKLIDMGGEIDEISPRSHPNYYADRLDSAASKFHHHRQILTQTLIQFSFRQHPNEWWHFCYGDQLWAWLEQQNGCMETAIACYGRIEF